jgi:hypothetical protein
MSINSGTTKQPLLPVHSGGEMATYGSSGSVLSKEQLMSTGADGLDEQQVAE